jgi:hypothetical protein
VPVVNRIERRVRALALNRGNPTRVPLRLPDLESAQFLIARAKASRPVLKASFEHSGHHGATWSLTWFQVLRNAGNDQPCHGVSPSPIIP